MATIVPAILEETKEGFAARAEQFERVSEAQRIQVDFCDGVFVPGKTISIKDVDLLNPAVFWEAHIMAQAPADFFEYQLAGFGLIIIHGEAYNSEAQVVAALTAIRGLGMKAGLGVNPETDFGGITQYAHLVDQYTLLTIHPGRQGQTILPESFNRIHQLCALLPDSVIEVDGGVKATNIAAVAAAGADLLVVGSALQDDPVRRFQDLQSALLITPV
ncbi:MAG: hypothetical protein KBD66_03250 [Candidatus Doudnabacteria bacterium]|nr:hypothetical protein [Candidatus Doudnabacteria bacterium]